MPPKKTSKKNAPAAHPFRHTRVTRASQALSQANSNQQPQSTTPPLQPPEAILRLRQKPKRGQKRSPVDPDDLVEASGSNTARKRTKVDPAPAQIPTRKPRGRPRKAPTDSQISPPSQDSVENPNDRKDKGKAKKPLPNSSSDSQNSDEILADRKGKGKSKQPTSSPSSEDRRAFNPPPNRSSDIPIIPVPDLSSDEYPAQLGRFSKSNKKAHHPLVSEDGLQEVRMQISLLQPEEASKKMFMILKYSDLTTEMVSLNTCIDEIRRSIKTIKSAQKELVWTTVLEAIENMETMLSDGTHLRSPTTHTTDLEVQLPVEWRLWKSEALVWLGEVHSAKEIFPRQADSIDKLYRYRVKGLIEYAEQSYEKALKSFDKAADRLGLSHSKDMDRRDGEVISLMERARERKRREEQIVTALRKRADFEETFKAHEWITKSMRDFQDPLETPIRLVLREILCDLSTLHETWGDDGLSDLRAYIQEQKIDMGGFRFDRRDNLPISHRPRVLALYFYLARAELYCDESMLSDHHFDILNRLEKEGWGPLGIMGADRMIPEINERDPASRIPTPDPQETSFESDGPPPAQKIKTFVDHKHYYATLELTSRAENDEIKRSYKRLLKSEPSNASKIQKAYNVLSDPVRRSLYDEQCWNSN